MKQLRRRRDEARGVRARRVPAPRRRPEPQPLPGPRALLPHERAAVPASIRHPSAAFPLMAPTAAQGRPRGLSGASLESRLDSLIQDAQQAVERMRARAQAMRDALREAHLAPAPAARGRFVVPPRVEQGPA